MGVEEAEPWGWKVHTDYKGMASFAWQGIFCGITS